MISLQTMIASVRPAEKDTQPLRTKGVGGELADNDAAHNIGEVIDDNDGGNRLGKVIEELT